MLCLQAGQRVYILSEMLCKTQITGCELYTSVTHTRLQDHSRPRGLDSAFFSAGTSLSHRLHSDYCFRRQGEGSVKRPTYTIAFLFPQSSTGCSLRSGRLPTTQEQRAAIRYDGGGSSPFTPGLLIRKTGDAGFMP